MCDVKARRSAPATGRPAVFSARTSSSISVVRLRTRIIVGGTDGAAFGGKKLLRVDPAADANAPTSVYAVDVDGDGDTDILSASAFPDIVWWENNGGEDFVGHTITNAADNATGVFAVDVDSDGDIDVLSSSFH